MAVIANPPSPTSNSYISNADAIAIWSADPYKLDFNAIITDQDIALKTATAMLDDVYGASYKGTLHDADNSLYWPRTGVTDPRTGVVITDYTDYPADIKRATALQAYHLYANNRETESADLISTNVKEKLDGVGEIERGTTAEQRSATNRPVIHPEVARIMGPYVTGRTSEFSSMMGRA